MSFDATKTITFTPISFGGTPNPNKTQKGGLAGPTGSKTLDWVNKHANAAAQTQNKINKAIFLAEKPVDAVKIFGTTLGNIKGLATKAVGNYQQVLGALEKLGVEFTEKDADDFLLRNSKKLVGEAQALFLKNNVGAYQKLKKLGGLKNAVSKKGRRIFKKRYGRRGS